MKFPVLVVILLVMITSAQANNTYCGSKLIDRLHYICKYGIKGMKNIHLARRYPNLRRKFFRHRRSSSEIIAHLNALDKANRFQELLQSERVNSESALEVLLRIADKLRKEELDNERSRRSVTTECCHKACTIRMVKNRYCERRRH